MNTRSTRFYKALLQFYPLAFRKVYQEEMILCFQSMVRKAASHDGRWGMAKVWLGILPDFIGSLFWEYCEQWRLRRDMMTSIPTVIDRYQVKAQIGDGSISTIFRAYDPVRQAEVAIKLLKPEKVNAGSRVPSYWNYLQREMEVMNALDHPAIPRAHGCFQSEAGSYLVMDLVPGRSLLEMLEASDGFLPEKEIIQWGIRTCEVLTYLHTRQPQPLLFRDVKPANLIQAPDGGFYVVDFGISVPYLPDHQYEKIGTEGYAAPEQYEGREEPRSDIYALGAALHHLATRIDPREEARRRPFTFAPPRAINPALSKPFAAVVQRALAYEPEDRYPSAAAMQAALEACL